MNEMELNKKNLMSLPSYWRETGRQSRQTFFSNFEKGKKKNAFGVFKLREPGRGQQISGRRWWGLPRVGGETHLKVSL